MEKIGLKASRREETGKSANKQLRRGGMIPAVIYKEGKEGISISVDKKAFWKATHTEAGGNAIISIGIDEGTKKEEKTVIVQAFQTDPLRDDIIHVDFHEISLTEKIRVHVPIRTKGESVGVADEDGVLNQVLWELDLECLPTNIPEHIDVNISELKIGESIHVKDLETPEGVQVMNDEEQMVVGVTHQQVEEEVVAEEGEEESSEPEVIKKGKQEEGAEEQEEAAGE
jgi:large subunit ribosomal protein L25